MDQPTSPTDPGQWVVITDQDEAADALARLSPHAVGIMLDAGDELVSDAVFGRRIRSLLRPRPDPSSVAAESPGNVVDLMGWLERSARTGALR